MKRIILCLDGTWNHRRAGAITTNVAKLFEVIAPVDGKGIIQRAIYVDGIASAEGETIQFLKGASGYGVAARVQHAYQQLVDAYQPGDEIYLFGFSRGAFEARSLAGLIALAGVAKPDGAMAIDEAWALHMKPKTERTAARLAAVRSAATYPVRIACVGVWDTVGNLGNPFFTGFDFWGSRSQHLPLNDAIEVGLHALAIDELRGPFRPTLWTLPEGQMLAPHQHLEQVWFAGSHADVGGGFRETGLSDVALRWMVERAGATTSLAFDREKLARTSRPDPLGPQHASDTGAIFGWSGVLPFIRLIMQAAEAIPGWRSAVIGSWRTGRVPTGEVPINESIHDSVIERFGHDVIELRGDRSTMIQYRPRNLAAVLHEPEPMPAAAQSTAAKPRRIKIFTVHGTFDHAATWDLWDLKDDPARPGHDRRFVNRLSILLRERGIALDQVDHSRFVWSGGNSHDERRTAAIGLKKAIQDQLEQTYARHGTEYYDGVYVVGHSHGGTVARLTMNLWDKPHDYYDPVHDAHFDEFTHDDECPTCLRERNGKVGPSTVRRPDGVITFGSPFVSFVPRRDGLLTARIGAWVFRIMAAALFAIPLYLTYKFRDPAPVLGFVWNLMPHWAKTVSMLIMPLAIGWLFASYFPRLFQPLARWLGKGGFALSLHAIFEAVKYAVLGAIAAYYIIWFAGWQDRVLARLPLDDKTFLLWCGWAALITAALIMVIAIPGSWLMWLGREVVGLRDKLPKKYDPAEDRPVQYVSYLTPGDEAGAHLRFFGLLTWAVQALALAASCVLAVGIATIVFIGIETALNLSSAPSILDRLGVSPVSATATVRDRFVVMLDALTAIPRIVWSAVVGSVWVPALGALTNAREVAWFVPAAVVVSILLVFMLLMPLVLLAIGIVYAVSTWLRGSGMVFGSEKFSWTLANRIAVTRRANQNSQIRVVSIAPEAWWRRELAHCFYYKNERVITDVADRLAGWANHQPTPAWPIEMWGPAIARWLVVALFVLSVFAISVPIARQFATFGPQLSMILGVQIGGGSGKGGAPVPAAEPELQVIAGATLCWSDSLLVAVPLDPPPAPPLSAGSDALYAKARPVWEAAAAQKYGPEWANWDLARKSAPSGSSCGSTNCSVNVAPCRPRAMECKDAPYVVEAGIEVTGINGQFGTIGSMRSAAQSALRSRWVSEVRTKFGAEWVTTAGENFKTLRQFKRPVEESCNDETTAAGAIQVKCQLSATPCLEPEQLPKKAASAAPTGAATPPAKP